MVAVACGALLWAGLAVAALRAPTLEAATPAVRLSDDDGGAAMFDARRLAPGEAVRRCVSIGVDSGAPADISIAAGGSGSATNHVWMEIEEGTGGSYADCGRFEGRTVYRGTLAQLVAEHPEGRGLTTWSAQADGERRTYRVTARLLDVAAAQGTSAEASLVWHGLAADGRPPAATPTPTPKSAPTPAGGPAPVPSPAPPARAPRDSAPAPGADGGAGSPSSPSPATGADQVAGGAVAAPTDDPPEGPSPEAAGDAGDPAAASRGTRSPSASADPSRRGRAREAPERGVTRPPSEFDEDREAGLLAKLRSGVLATVQAVGKAARAAAPAAERAAFPLLLAVVVFLFLAIQNVLDRRDPKLAESPLRRAGMLTFSPPPADEGAG